MHLSFSGRLLREHFHRIYNRSLDLQSSHPAALVQVNLPELPGSAEEPFHSRTAAPSPNPAKSLEIM